MEREQNRRRLHDFGKQKFYVGKFCIYRTQYLKNYCSLTQTLQHN